MDLIEKGVSESRHPWELARLDVVKDIAEKFIHDFDNKNILDLGCGDLFFIENFAVNKLQTGFYAVDTAFDNEFIEKNSRGNIHLFKTVEDIRENDMVFDLVFLMDVIEHIEDDFGFLSRLVNCRYINEKTIFIITVPAYQSLFSSHDHFLKHFRRYTNRSLKKLVFESGLKPLENGYFFLSLLLPRAAEVIVEKLGNRENKKQGTDLTHWKNGVFITRSIKNFLILDYKFQKMLRMIGLRLPGLSNYIVCKRSA